MSLTVEFIPSSKEAELFVPPPKPSKNYIPSWYKNIKKSPKLLTFDGPGDISNRNLKDCVPFLDALTHGYIQETWTDIYISTNESLDEIVDYNWPIGPSIMSHRTKNTNFNIDTNIFYNQEFIWNEQWIPKCPRGYSVLYTSPLNIFNLPFRSLDAIIDSDKYFHQYNGQYPFYINKGFSGLIPAGTPMYQIIFIKRNNWKSKILKYDEEKNLKNNHFLRKNFVDGYKNIFWQKKSFS